MVGAHPQSKPGMKKSSCRVQTVVKFKPVCALYAAKITAFPNSVRHPFISSGIFKEGSKGPATALFHRDLEHDLVIALGS